MKENKRAFPVLYPDAAGIDIASQMHYVAVPADRDAQPIRCFASFTEDLHALTAWLKQCRISTVAMEATGIYWVSLFLLLEQEGFEVVLVNARHVKNVRGKKTDISDAEWIRQLHSCGLLTASFQPDRFTRELRTYMRCRADLLQMSATHIRKMHKALEQMNIKVQHVLADVTGKTGQAIISAILQGERDPEKLCRLCHPRIKASAQQVRRSLEGFWKEEHLFELRLSWELYQSYQAKIRECDQQMEALLSSQARTEHTPPQTGKAKTGKLNKNDPAFNVTTLLGQITGTDVTGIFGISNSTALAIISEIGTDMSKWPTAKHFTAWLNLAPNNRVSGGKLLSSKTSRKKNRAGQMFKMAAYGLQRSKHWLAAFFHRIKAKCGAPKAITATARKIAVIFYTMIKNKVLFQPHSMESYAQTIKEQQLKRLHKQARALGLQLQPVQVT